MKVWPTKSRRALAVSNCTRYAEGVAHYDQIEQACSLLSYQDWGSTPAAIDSCLTVCDEFDVACNIHTDTLNESAFCEGEAIYVGSKGC